MATRKEISAAVGQRYRLASRDEKGLILDEFVALTHYHRSSVIGPKLFVARLVEKVQAIRGIHILKSGL